MLIAVPSKGRAGITKTNKIFKNTATFFVPQSEYHQYKDLVKNVVPVPNEIQGITKTRNWILNYTDEKRVVMIDDDIKKLGYVKRNERNVNHINLKDENFWIDEFVKYFELTEQLDYKIWGVTTDDSTRSAYSYKPIMFKTYALGSIMGIVNDKEYLFNEDFKVKEDYELCLRHIKDKGGILAIRYLHWENDHWGKDGGCKDYRTIEMEKKAIKDLIKLYPSMISNVKRKANEFTIKLNL